MSIQPIQCKNVEEFFSRISLCNKDWWDEKSECHWIFRGQGASHELKPSLYRLRNNNDPLYQAKLEEIGTTLIKTVPFINASTVEGSIRSSGFVEKCKLDEAKIKNLAEIIKAAYVELALTENFLIRCNEVRLFTPALQLFKDQDSGISSVYFFHSFLAQYIKKFTTYFQAHEHTGTIIFWKRFFPYLYPEAMALARHHLVPSRLLDWSREPLTAAFFAAYENKDDDICVWALNKRYLSKDNGGGQIEFYNKLSRTGLEFLHIQKGLFTDMLGNDMYQYIYGEWPTLDQYLMKTYINASNNQPYPQDTYLRKILLANSERECLLKRLDGMGYNTYSLMPTYDNVGRSVVS